MGKLDGKVVLVTGSGRGFGRGMAIAYAVEGAKVIGAARTRSELNEMAEVAEAHGGEVLPVPTDLSKEKEIYKLRDKVLEEFNKIDVIVNNAATSPWKTFEETTISDWDKTIAVNLRAPLILTKAFFGTMKKQKSASIINISSKSAEMGFVAELCYCPSKFGLEGMTQCLALELQPYNIAVNSLNVSAPTGKTLKPTELTLAEAEDMPDEIREKYAEDMELVEAFKEAWVFLALQNGKSITGQRFRTKELAQYLKENGWEAAIAKWSRKLTKAVYVSYDLPEKVRYQTPEGGWKEIKFE